jgi:RNA polymerase sigma-70 factor, ECF subfamily
LAAWRGLERFDGRSSLRAWLYRIATNRCPNALRDKRRRPREVEPIAAPPELVGRFANAVESGDVDGVVSLLTEDAWLTMPPQPFEYQGHAAIASFPHDRAALRGRPLRLAPTRANGQPALGCYLPDAQTAIARPNGLMVLTLQGHQISAITWFGDSSVFPDFGLPRTLRGERRRR